MESPINHPPFKNRPRKPPALKILVPPREGDTVTLSMNNRKSQALEKDFT